MVAVTPTRIELGDLDFSRGAHLLVKRALVSAPVGSELAVVGSAPDLPVHLRAWCRAQGHGYRDGAPPVVTRGERAHGRWRGAESTGTVGSVVDHALPHWGLAARGASVEVGCRPLSFDLDHREDIWCDDAARIYARAVAAQWDPATAIDWSAPFELAEEMEDAVVQVMTYLIENETVALQVPARFLARVHPHFREVMQLLAVQAADEARHIEVFTRRAALRRDTLGLSTAGGQASLATLLDEPDFALATFLLSVLGEGSFLALLWFLEVHAPDPITRQVVKLAAQDEARHVAFGVAHLQQHVRAHPDALGRLATAIEHRHDRLRDTAGLNEEVFDALILLAAGSLEPSAVAEGFARVVDLTGEMDLGRQRRLVRIGFDERQAERLSKLHTRNFM